MIYPEAAIREALLTLVTERDELRAALEPEALSIALRAYCGDRDDDIHQWEAIARAVAARALAEARRTSVGASDADHAAMTPRNDAKTALVWDVQFDEGSMHVVGYAEDGTIAAAITVNAARLVHWTAYDGPRGRYSGYASMCDAIAGLAALGIRVESTDEA